MKQIGFADKWIFLVMTCVRTVKYLVLLNGQPFGLITPTRGLQQGDPLSPYFFILCVEGLSTVINRAKREGGITGLSIIRRGTRLNHLFFVDRGVNEPRLNELLLFKFYSSS